MDGKISMQIHWMKRLSAWRCWFDYCLMMMKVVELLNKDAMWKTFLNRGMDGFRISM